MIRHFFPAAEAARQKSLQEVRFPLFLPESVKITILSLSDSATKITIERNKP